MPPSPVASPPSWRSERKIESAKAGPFCKSHQKKPVKIVNRKNSAKNSPMSALRKAIKPNVHTMEITTSAQKRRVAAAVIIAAQVLAAAE